MKSVTEYEERVIHMKIPQRTLAILTTAFLLSGSFPAAAAETESIQTTDKEMTAKTSLPEMTTVSGNQTASTDGILTDMPQQDTAGSEGDEKDYPIPGEAPPFRAHIEHPYMGYTVRGVFKDFTPDIIRIDTLYSLDGGNWQTVVGGDWLLSNLGTDDKDKLYTLENQYCVYNAYEPMKSYTSGEIDRFYLKLRITKKNGLSYETQSAVIERGGLQPIPEGTAYNAMFSSALAVREPDPGSPYRFRMYGRYQLTVSADATAEEISALLPDTLPVEVQLSHGRDFRIDGTVNCPVTWKTLSLPRLSAGESITIPDAAEEIVVPSGTLLTTPVGTFRLDRPIFLDSFPLTDEVRLVLNVSDQDGIPAGTLKEDRDGLKIAFRQTPTGAADIQAYVLTEGESIWTELTGLSLLKELNTQPSTENSGFALVLRSDQEPYRSFLAAQKAGTIPTPFFVGLKIKGGIYDGRQLILPWPDIYDELPDLPEIRAFEGNEGNAGADDKNDGTASGQRPNLPYTPDDSQGGLPPDSSPDTDDNQERLPPNPSAGTDDSQDGLPPNPSADAGGSLDELPPNPSVDAEGSLDGLPPNPSADAGGSLDGLPPNPSVDAGGSLDRLPPNPPANAGGSLDGLPPNPSADAKGSLDGLSPNPSVNAENVTDTGNKDKGSAAGQQPNPPHTPEGGQKGLPPAHETGAVTGGEENSTETGQQPHPVLIGTETKQQAAPIHTSEIASAIPEKTLPATPDTGGTSAAAPKESINSSSHTISTAADTKNAALLPATAAITGCIGAAVCKAKGISPFRRIIGRILSLLRKPAPPL